MNPTSLISQSGPVRGIYNFLWNRWYINPAYYRIFVYGTISCAVGLWKTIEVGFFDKISNGVAHLSLGISHMGQRADVGIVDGTINNIASGGRGISSTLKKIQTGIPQDYVTVFAIGLFALIVAILFFM
jgi:NADH:ubiquinone oxidoreductase subunit 5 (subunit L)/multisubunit Na+/H+ antiporter MnhA subunit